MLVILAFYALLISRQSLGQSVDPIVIKGSKFFFKTNGIQFLLKGVIYQQAFSNDLGSISENLAAASISTTYVDALTDASACQRDVPYLNQLQVNVVRSYGIDPSKDHSNCLQVFADAGIYVLADLPTPGYTISNTNPQWNDVLYKRYTAVIDALEKYDNVLGFIVGEDVFKGPGSPSDSSSYVKAAVRDMKAYIREKNYRAIPVGYANTNAAGYNYLDCGNPAEDIDFLGANMRNWCGDNDYGSSGWENVTKSLHDYSVPAFLAEYGCSTPSQRNFTEIGLLYGYPMNGFWSGGLIYEYFDKDDQSGYGLVSVRGASVTKLANFTAVSTQMAKVTSSIVNAASYTPDSTTTKPCPAGVATTLPRNPVAPQVSASSTTDSPSSSTTTAQSNMQNSLSTGAKAGIGIGAIIAIVLLALGVFFIYRSRKTKRKCSPEENDAKWGNKPELPVNSTNSGKRGISPHMLDGSSRAELDTKTHNPIQELPTSGTEVFEASAGPHGLPELSAPKS
ncbi:MAG: hypothetical protein M1812_005200 [Candelaria pacifica]|nr:MAG: hypothetical protein M1812_005200 [Candelaria pacifica]